MQKKTKLVLKNLSGGSDLEVHFNWKERQDDTTVHLRAGKVEIDILKRDIWQLAFLLAPAVEQEKLIPVKSELKRRFEKTVSVTAQKNIKKGEEVAFKLAFDIPEEEIRELLNMKDTKATP